MTAAISLCINQMKVTLRPQVLKEVQYSSPFDYIKNEICNKLPGGYNVFNINSF